MKALAEALGYWNARTPRERLALGLAAAALAATALYLLLLGPGLDARSRLSASLPKLRAQLEDMRQQEKEIALLRKKVAANARHADPKPVLQAALARTSFSGSVTRMDALSGSKVVLTLTPVAFDDWIGWVEKLQRDFGIRLEDCRIAALDQPGLVRVEATFAASGPR